LLQPLTVRHAETLETPVLYAVLDYRECNAASLALSWHPSISSNCKLVGKVIKREARITDTVTDEQFKFGPDQATVRQVRKAPAISVP